MRPSLVAAMKFFQLVTDNDRDFVEAVLSMQSPVVVTAVRGSLASACSVSLQDIFQGPFFPCNNRHVPESGLLSQFNTKFM